MGVRLPRRQLSESMMTKEEAFNLVAKHLAEQFEIPKEKIKPGAHMFHDLGLDSIDALDMVGALEAEYNFEIKTTELKSIRTVQDVVDFVVTVMPGGVDLSQ
jgi:acyl carrier protein